MKKAIIVILVIAALATVFLFKKDNGSAASEKSEFIKVQRGNMVITLKESGFLNAVEESTIKNEVALRSLDILEVIPDGTFVEKGDFLIELDSEPLMKEKIRIESEVSDMNLALTEAENTYSITESEIESELTSSKNNIEFARLDLEKFETLDKNRQLDEALQDIAIAEDQLKLSEQGYKASVELAEKGFETKSKVDRDKLDLSAKEKSLKSSLAKHEMLKTYDLHKESLELSKKLEETENKYQRAEKEGDNKIQKAKAKLENAKIKLARVQDELKSLEEQLAKTVMKAPLSGYALYPNVRRYDNSKKIEKGKTVRLNEELIRIPNMSKLKVDIEVAEHFVSDLQVGQKVIVTIDSLKDQKFSGVLGNVALLPIKGNSYGKGGIQKYKVVVDMVDETLPESIKPQISASTEIILDTLDDVVFVPIQSVHTVKGKRVVYIKDSGSVGYELREVKIGKMDTSYMQILEGLAEGEEVLVSEPSI